jgi:hypothetical protein
MLLSDTTGFWISRGRSTAIPTIYLCPKDVVASNTLIIYPNPSGGKISVETSTEMAVNIYNLVGDKVYSGLYIPYSEIDLSGQAAGIYILSMSDQGKETRKPMVLVK